MEMETETETETEAKFTYLVDEVVMGRPKIGVKY